jgi:hypothetical protein
MFELDQMTWLLAILISGAFGTVMLFVLTLWDAGWDLKRAERELHEVADWLEEDLKRRLFDGDDEED